jgi:DNA-binding beta-propeller fold protein YncE
MKRLLITLLIPCTALTCWADDSTEKSSARFRNRELAARANPGEREAVLAVTKWGANVIVGESGATEAVQLEGCIFPDAVLKVLHELPQMKQLKIGHSKVSNAGLRHLVGLPNLESLTLTQTNIGDEGLVHLEGLKTLKSLSLHMSLVSDAGMRSLAHLENLEQLDLENTSVGDEGLSELSGLTKLKKLLISRTKVTDAGLAHLSNLTNLEELAVYHNQVSDAGIEFLGSLTKLKELDVEGTQVSDAGLSSLLSMDRLETLNLRYTRVTTGGLRQLDGLKRLKRIWTEDHQLSIKTPKKQWQVWLASAYGDDIYVYEVGSFKLLKRLEVGPNPHGLSVTEDGCTVHVGVEHFDDPTGEIVWVDTKTLTIRGRLDVGPQPQEHECTPDGKWIYVPCGDGHWWVIDGEQQRVVTKIATGGRPHNTVCSPDGKRMYLSPMGFPHAVTIVDVPSHQVIGELPFGDTTRPPAISSDERLFFENIDNMLGFQVADIANRKVVQTVRHTIPTEREGEWSRSHGLGVRPDQQEIWSCNVEHHMVHIHEMNSGSYHEIATITVPGRAYWLSFSPDSRYCFVSVRSKRQVAVIDCDSKQIVRMLDAGRAVKRSEVVGVPLD